MVLSAGLGASAFAQSPTIELLDPSYRADAAIDKERAPERPHLRGVLGAGIGVGPRFEGSDQYRGRLVPVIHFTYGSMFFGLGGVGANLYRDARWRLGASLSLGGGRKESDDPRLQGLGDVDRTVLGGVFAVYANRGLLARAHLATDIGGNGQGTVVRLDAYGRMRVGEGLAFFAGPGLTWADRRHMQTFYGVTAEQAARSGYPEFEAGNAVQGLRLSAGAAYRAAPNWRLVGLYSLSQLRGDAAASPIIETRTNSSFFVSAMYLLR